ncbi:hypothetical protein [Streptomyces sp. DH12]|uniref:hypothetical protein n=1 Tax=Streptomyces sp. DH12 TaxID=2857010 RepID=UPI001E610AC2|nr:hypothetical protein [Streptomyces sp. DH12]
MCAPLAGALAWDAVGDARAQQCHDRRTATAHLVADPEPGGRGIARTRATVRWTAPEGGRRTDRVPVDDRLARGASVTVWIEADGSLTSALLGPAASRFDAAVAGLAVTGASPCSP